MRNWGGLAVVAVVGLGGACPRPIPPPPPTRAVTRHTEGRFPQLHLDPHVGFSGQRATVTVTGLVVPARSQWRWARLTVESPDGSRPVDSLWAVPTQTGVTRTWLLRGEGPTYVILSLYDATTEQPDWQTTFLLDTHDLRSIIVIAPLMGSGVPARPWRPLPTPPTDGSVGLQRQIRT